MSTVNKTKKGASRMKNDKASQKSHLPIPDEKQKAGRGRLTSKEKKQLRPLVKQGSKKELLDENTKLKQEIHAQSEQIKKMEATLKLESEKLERLKLEAENKENSYQDDLKLMKEKQEKAESSLLDHQKRVLQANLDPVTLTKIDVLEQDEENIFLKQTKAKEEVVMLRQNLKTVSAIASEEFDHLKKMEKDLDSIIGCGENT